MVVLTGFTTKGPLKQEAEGNVKSLKWVEHVVNEIEILPVTPELRSLRGSILGGLSEALPQSFPAGHANVRIKVTADFQVTLVGVIDPLNQLSLESAVVEIKQMPLVKSVTNQVLAADLAARDPRPPRSASTRSASSRSLSTRLGGAA